MTRHTFRVLEWLIEHPQPELQLAINSNLVVPDNLCSRFFDLVSKIVRGGCVKTFELYTSVDAHGGRADYIRNGLDYGIWLSNVRRFVETVPDARLIIMCAFNALSVTSFACLYADVIELRKAYSIERIGLDLPYLRYPEHQSIMVLTPNATRRSTTSSPRSSARPKRRGWRRSSFRGSAR